MPFATTVTNQKIRHLVALWFNALPAYASGIRVAANSCKVIKSRPQRPAAGEICGAVTQLWPRDISRRELFK